MPQTPGLKAALKRGALIAAANWPLVIVGFVADSSVKLLLAVPIVGGAFLVALLLDTPLSDLLRGDVRDIVTSIVAVWQYRIVIEGAPRDGDDDIPRE